MMGYVEDHHAELRRKAIAWLLHRGVEDPDEVADATLARCWEIEHGGKAINNGYVFATLRSQHVTAYRKRPRRLPPEASVDPETVALDGLAAEAILLRLDGTDRDLVGLHLAGYDCAGQAAALGLSVEAVKSRWYRLRRRMREQT